MSTRESRRIPYSDGCPRCYRRNNPPTAQLQQGRQVSCLYHCTCGHEWTCNWSVEAAKVGRDGPEAPGPSDGSGDDSTWT